MIAVARLGYRFKSHKGWRASYIEKRTSAIDRRNWHYKLISPDGNVYTTNNLTTFCKYFNMSAGHLMSVANGKSLSHMGFIAEKISILPKESLTHYYEIFKFNYYVYLPNGKQIICDNLQKPCKENNLFISDAEYYLKHSKINSGFVGFRLKKSEDTAENRNIKIEDLKLKIKKCIKLYNYIFQYKDGKIVGLYSCSVIEFCKNNNLSYGKIHRDINKYPEGIMLGDIKVTRELIYKDFLTNTSLFTNIEAT